MSARRHQHFTILPGRGYGRIQDGAEWPSVKGNQRNIWPFDLSQAYLNAAGYRIADCEYSVSLLQMWFQLMYAFNSCRNANVGGLFPP